MIRKCALTLFCFLTFVLHAQEKVLNDITSFEVKNSGTFLDENNDVDGYYFFYELDKLKKGKREYAVKILDNDLNEIASKSYIGDKDDMLIQSKFNNQTLMFAILNLEEKYYKVFSFDKSGEQGAEVIIPISKMDARVLEYTLKTDIFLPLFAIDNKGFVFQQFMFKIGSSASKLLYIPTDGGKSWEYNQTLEKKTPQSIKVIDANEKFIVLSEAEISIKSFESTPKIVVLDINTGKVVFEHVYDKKDYRAVSNVFLTEEKSLVVLGEYFENDIVYENPSLGLFTQTFDLNGKVLSDKKIDWESDVNKVLGSEIKKNEEYILFHDIIRAQNGSYFAIAEKYHQTNNKKGKKVNSLTTSEAIFFEFSSNFDVKAIKVFNKGNFTSKEVTTLKNPETYAMVLNLLGFFDYEFTQIDKSRDRFYSNFVHYNTSPDNEDDKSILLKTIIYNEGKLSEDEIVINTSNEDKSYGILPAKLGHVVLLEYDKKNKALKMHLEKLNID